MVLRTWCRCLRGVQIHTRTTSKLLIWTVQCVLQWSRFSFVCLPFFKLAHLNILGPKFASCRTGEFECSYVSCNNDSFILQMSSDIISPSHVVLFYRDSTWPSLQWRSCWGIFIRSTCWNKDLMTFCLSYFSHLCHTEMFKDCFSVTEKMRVIIFLDCFIIVCISLTTILCTPITRVPEIGEVHHFTLDISMDWDMHLKHPLMMRSLFPVPESLFLYTKKN